MRLVPEPDAVRWVLLAAHGRGSAEPPPPPAWEGMAAQLLANRLSPLAVHLLGPAIRRLPPDERRALEAAQLDAVDRTEVAARQLEAIAKPLNASSIAWVVLKSWPLAARLYPTPACRPSVDLDLLAHPRDHAAIVDLLESLGYREATGVATPTYHRHFDPADPRGLPVELHGAAEPEFYHAPRTAAILETRARYPAPFGSLWIPDSALERDLLVRHYCRHAGSQAILLLDLLLHTGGAPLEHDLGDLVRVDLERLDLEPSISGPRRLRQQPLRRWMATHTFSERRFARLKSPIGIALALSRSPHVLAIEIGRTIWPRFPTRRWRDPADPSRGIAYWRLRRLLRMGR